MVICRSISIKILSIVIIVFACSLAAQEPPSSPIRSFEGHNSRVKSLDFSPDGTLLASASTDSTVILWEVSTGRSIRTFVGHNGMVLSVVFSPDGGRLATASTDKTVKIWDINTAKVIRTIEHQSRVQCVGFSSNGLYLASGASNDLAIIWDASTWEKIRTLKGHQATVLSLTFSPDNQSLATASSDNTAKLWDVATGELMHTLDGHNDWIYSVAFSPDSRQLATGSKDKTAKLWEVSTGALVGTFEGHKQFVTSVAFSPDEGLLATCSIDQTARFWDIATFGQLLPILSHNGSVLAIVFAPDGSSLATGSGFGHVQLWHPANPIFVLKVKRDNLAQNIEALIDKEIAALNKPKSEFETTVDYNSRIQRIKSEEKRIRNNSEQLLANERARIDAEIENLIIESRRIAAIENAILHSYDADNQIFPIEISGIKYNLQIPLADAPVFKNRFNSLETTGMEQYNTNGRWEYIDLVLVDPLNGKTYPIGKELTSGSEKVSDTPIATDANDDPGNVSTSQPSEPVSMIHLPTIAILDFDGIGISVQEAQVLTNRLGTKIVELRRYQVIERGQMQAILTEQDFQLTGCTSNECAVEIGQLIGAQQMLAGSFGKLGTVYTIDMKIIDVETSRVLRTSSYNSEGSINLLLTQGLDIAVKRIIGLN